ncbi:MAG: lipid-A-disaccharide synthase [Candidatus Melainabacteria bacterium GWF2_37_15]|nr:MAG: lipid-A-disaccharide synthase [Candidatus Melainabacteria bacterium GWF2_37_15]
MTANKKLFIITGEHSGDVHASFIVKELKKLNPNVQIEAVGGKNLEAEGVKLFSDHSKMAVVGLDAIKSIFSHIKLGKKLVDYLKDEYKPDLVLLIDYGGFNLRMAKELKKRGIEIFYYISPQVWATRKGRINTVKKYISKMMLILPFEEKIYKEKDVDAEYVGHPLISQLPQCCDKEDFIKQNNLDPYRKIVGIFPGSRKMEINNLMPIFLDSMREITRHSKKVQFCIAQAPNLDDKLINKHIENISNAEIKVLKNQNHALLANSDVVIAASGTISLEAALYNTPVVISYKGPYIAYLVYLLIRYIKFVALPNIIADKEIVKEFIQHRAKPDLIANEVLSLLHNETKRNKMIQDLGQIRNKLGDKVASQEVARIINDRLK